MKKLSRDFFDRSTLLVAEELIGKVLLFNGQKGLITETEAYMGFDDPASHAYKGKTPRNQVMFGKPGFSYVYFIYGMYHCLNVVTEKAGFPAAVLIRGLKLLEETVIDSTGVSIADATAASVDPLVHSIADLQSSVDNKTCLHLNGPGKICRHFGITKDHYGIDMIKSQNFYFACIQHKAKVIKTPRIGIKVGTEKLWRFLGVFDDVSVEHS